MKVKLSRAGRRHKLGRARAEFILMHAGEPTLEGDLLHWEAADERGVRWHIAAKIADEDADLLIIIHAMPLEFGRTKR